MDNATRLTILTAQYAGGSPNSIVSDFLAQGASAALFCVCVIIIIGIVIDIVIDVLDHFIDKNETKKKDKKDVR